VVLRGAGTAFCGGADVSELRSLSDPGALFARAELTAQLLQAVAGLDIPVLAAVNGPAVGAGAGIAFCCDGIVMAEDATLSFPELQHGIPPLLILPGLQRHIGGLATFEVLTRGKPITAHQAMDRRWVSRVVPNEQLQSEVRAWAVEISELPRQAVAATKQLARATATLPLAEALSKAVATYR
jgi:enoyl-CoA hydratase/carnithine racemase